MDRKLMSLTENELLSVTGGCSNLPVESIAKIVTAVTSVVESGLNFIVRIVELTSASQNNGTEVK